MLNISGTVCAYLKCVKNCNEKWGGRKRGDGLYPGMRTSEIESKEETSIEWKHAYRMRREGERNREKIGQFRKPKINTGETHVPKFAVMFYCTDSFPSKTWQGSEMDALFKTGEKITLFLRPAKLQFILTCEKVEINALMQKLHGERMGKPLKKWHQIAKPSSTRCSRSALNLSKWRDPFWLAKPKWDHNKVYKSAVMANTRVLFQYFQIPDS